MNLICFSEDVAMAAHDDECDGFLLPKALLAPGILHITRNMTKEIDASLPSWKDWL